MHPKPGVLVPTQPGLPEKKKTRLEWRKREVESETLRLRVLTEMQRVWGWDPFWDKKNITPPDERFFWLISKGWGFLWSEKIWGKFLFFVTHFIPIADILV